MKTITTAEEPVANHQNALITGSRSPLLMQDYYLMERLAHQNRERILEHTMHAKGSGAYGTLSITHDISKYTKADLFNEFGKKLPYFYVFLQLHVS